MVQFWAGQFWTNPNLFLALNHTLDVWQIGKREKLKLPSRGHLLNYKKKKKKKKNCYEIKWVKEKSSHLSHYIRTCSNLKLDTSNLHKSTRRKTDPKGYIIKHKIKIRSTFLRITTFIWNCRGRNGKYINCLMHDSPLLREELYPTNTAFATWYYPGPKTLGEGDKQCPIWYLILCPQNHFFNNFLQLIYSISKKWFSKTLTHFGSCFKIKGSFSKVIFQECDLLANWRVDHVHQLPLCSPWTLG